MADYTIGGDWGDAIHWSDPEQFQQSITHETTFRVYGFKSSIPRVGDTLKGEFIKSWMWFTFVSVEPCGDPPDMFFADVRCIKQEMKTYAMLEGG